MAYNSGDVRITAIRRTFMNRNGQSIPAYELRFTIRNDGDYAVRVPTEGYTDQVGIQAVTKVAKDICATLDAFGS